MRDIETARVALRAGQTTSLALTEAALDRARDPAGEGERVFTRLYADRALQTARAADMLRDAGHAPLPLQGIPISIKDLFDVAGEPTPAGSVVLRDGPVAAADAPIVARLRGAGAVLVGRTNMTEFAYSGLGLNPHYGTPRNPFDRATGRIPGGSSAGGAVSVTDGMALGTIGTDTGGSCRIPAALCGIVGYKPSQQRVSRDGAVPLSTSLDSIGPLARTVADCALLDAVIAGEAEVAPPPPFPLDRLTVGVPGHYVMEGMDDDVARAFERARSALSAAGLRVIDIPLAMLERLPALNSNGGIASAEAFHWHRDLLATGANRYDPNVSARILAGREHCAADYIELLRQRRAMIAEFAAETAGLDALMMPTVPTIAAPIAPLQADEAAYRRTNLLMLRNPSAFNFLDVCGISIPCHETGAAPVGLMLTAANGADRRLFAIARAVEAVVAPREA
ncbi:amidase [Oceanibacterium hippocampi]|uniref:Glutamyl-tRNA(Gln) amidotransferase subunit A n=1 Tax=Oceanibacterium hippocampi TaxID=745714 RepID=A0A1Y5RV25_9PROT|nr:amidase [Oceanibacterium hippocampi]SLN25809.1 Glutamyl-tRNA(Gln) amidotransferase subunit A [Oceanibacterium hippocampi]